MEAITATIPEELKDYDVPGMGKRAFHSFLVGVDLDTGKEIVTAQLYEPRNPKSYHSSVIRCILFVHNEKVQQFAASHGKAGGGGYHKPSAALDEAIRNMGIKLDESIHGVGDGAMTRAIEAIMRAMGHERVHVVMVEK